MNEPTNESQPTTTNTTTNTSQTTPALAGVCLVCGGGCRDMLQRYADGTLDFEPTCPISLLSRQLDVMDEYALILRRRANIEHISLGEQRIDTATRDAR